MSTAHLLPYSGCNRITCRAVNHIRHHRKIQISQQNHQPNCARQLLWRILLPCIRLDGTLPISLRWCYSSHSSRKKTVSAHLLVQKVTARVSPQRKWPRDMFTHTLDVVVTQKKSTTTTTTTLRHRICTSSGKSFSHTVMCAHGCIFAIYEYTRSKSSLLGRRVENSIRLASSSDGKPFRNGAALLVRRRYQVGSDAGC